MTDDQIERRERMIVQLITRLEDDLSHLGSWVPSVSRKVLSALAVARLVLRLDQPWETTIPQLSPAAVDQEVKRMIIERGIEIGLLWEDFEKPHVIKERAEKIIRERGLLSLRTGMLHNWAALNDAYALMWEVE